MMPLCKGDPHRCYPLSCPGGGKVDHVEPIFGIFSNHSFDESDDAGTVVVYDDDVIQEQGGSGKVLLVAAVMLCCGTWGQNGFPMAVQF